jgi:hypothetical protein
MVRKTLLGLIACTLVASVAVAEDGPVGGTVSVGVVSSYMWNGFDRVESFGLESGPSVQPRVSVGVRNTGLSVNVGGSFVVNDNSELQETTYGVSFVRPVSPVVTVGAGYTYYDNRVSEIGGVQLTTDPNNHEVWGSVELASAIGVKPNVAVKYELPSVDGQDAFAVVVGGVKYAMPLSGLNLGTASVGLDWNADVVYNSGVKSGGVDVVKSGVTAVDLGLAAPVHAGSFVVTPSVNYQVTVADEVKAINGEDNQFWATVGVAYGF